MTRSTPWQNLVVQKALYKFLLMMTTQAANCVTLPYLPMEVWVGHDAVADEGEHISGERSVCKSFILILKHRHSWNIEKLHRKKLKNPEKLNHQYCICHLQAKQDWYRIIQLVNKMITVKKYVILTYVLSGDMNSGHAYLWTGGH